MLIHQVRDWLDEILKKQIEQSHKTLFWGNMEMGTASLALSTVIVVGAIAVSLGTQQFGVAVNLLQAIPQLLQALISGYKGLVLDRKTDLSIPNSSKHAL